MRQLFTYVDFYYDTWVIFFTMLSSDDMFATSCQHVIR